MASGECLEKEPGRNLSTRSECVHECAHARTRLHAAVGAAQRNGMEPRSFLSDLKVRPPKKRGERERRELDYRLPFATALRVNG